MYQIAVCDPEVECLNENHNMTRSILSELHVPHMIESYQRPETLLEVLSLNRRRYHLLLLGIRFSGMDGISLARNLRKMGVQSSIIFITAYEQHVFEGYAVGALQYFLKPVKPEVIKEAIIYDLRHNRVRDELLYLKNREWYVVPSSQLVYVESQYRYVILYMRDGSTREFYGKLKAVEEQTPPGQFFQCHKSYLANLHYVIKANSRSVLMETGATIPVSRTYSKGFNMAIKQYY